MTDAEPQDWKRKYLLEAEAHERGQRSWQDERMLLQRLLSRTSLAAKGQRETLDVMLDELRETVRNGETDFTHLHALRERIDQELIAMDGPAGDAADGELRRAGVVDAVLALLDRLLDTVELPEERRAMFLAQRERLAAGHDWDSLQATLVEINELVGMSVKQLQDEFAGFLDIMERRLAELRMVLSVQGTGSTDRRAATEAIEQAMQQNLQALGAEARETTSIEALKSAVEGHVDRVSEELSTYREMEMERESFLESELVAAQDKLAMLELQSHDIRQMLEEERVRATTDPLTQLPNRTVWEERLAVEEARWQRYGHPAVIGVVDIDKFKEINDQHGHKIGDRVLQLVARTMRANLRKTDFIARYGGEEFVLLLTDTGAEAALRVVNSLRERVAAMPLYFQGSPIHVTVSAGLAALDEKRSASATFDRADQAMYQAKSEGRNRVVVTED